VVLEWVANHDTRFCVVFAVCPTPAPADSVLDSSNKEDQALDAIPSPAPAVLPQLPSTSTCVAHPRDQRTGSLHRLAVSPRCVTCN